MASSRESCPKRPPDLLLQMDHWVEDLSPAQLSYYSKADKECSEILSRINDLIKKEGGEVIERGQDVMVIQTSGGSSSVPSLSSLLSSSSQVPVGGNSNTLAMQIQQPQGPTIQAVTSQQLLIQSGPGQTTGRNARQTTPQVPLLSPNSSTFQLVMDPRLGLIVNAVPNQQPPANQVVQTTTPPPPVQPAPVQPVTHRVRPAPTAPRPVVSKATITTANSNQSKPTFTSTTSAPASTTMVTTQRTKLKTTTTISPAVTAPLSTPTIPASGNRPTENNSIGGLSAGNPNKKNFHETGCGPDSREVAFNKMSGKTFPSLVVIARPHLRTKELSQIKVNQERTLLDGKVKSVLMYSATKFTEWLIQQGLVRSEQYCSVHSNTTGPLKLKLGMYSDVSKFPYSGGYVWISECCPAKFVSVFSGSVFEGSPHPPSVLLKLMYHWCCQTNVQNVVQWVKVDNFYVKNFFTSMRSVCVAAVQELHEKLGGPQKKVEVGVISLGTTSQDGNMRQVKVEVLGVMDPESKLVRLRAVEPLQDGERNYKRRFVKILEPLELWVHKESIIVTDFTVDKGTLQNMGFSQVHQATIPESSSSAGTITNQNIMEYLRRIVPRMFQNTLSLLSRQIIQQFLDELVWRERWGPVPSQAFDSLVSHLAAQTKLDSGESLLLKLGKIAANPFRKWDYINWKNNGLINLGGLPSATITGNSSQSTTPRIISTFSTSNRTGAVVQKPPSKELVVSEPSSVPKRTNPLVSIALQKKFQLVVEEEDVSTLLDQAIIKIEKGMSLRKAIELFKIPRSLLMERVQKVFKNRRIDRVNVFSPDEEQDIVDHLFTLHDWGYPFGRWDIRLVVKQYLDCSGRIEVKFKENFPGDLWIEKFLTRHPTLKEKLCRNIPSRGTFIDTDAVQQYILNLSSVIQGVPPDNVINFMEVGLTGDPLRSMAVELRDLRYPVGKRKVKSAASMMLACTAKGHILPVYIIFEGKTFTINKGPAPGEYYGAKCGWFDESAFEQWLESVLLPWADNLSGKKIVIGDSLAQLFTVRTQALCLDKDITFVCMPCNVTNLLSPLDVALFDKLKIQWRSLARIWSTTHGERYISVEEFPIHIHELLSISIVPDMPEKIREIFKNVGLYPFNSKATVLALEKGGVSLKEAKDPPTKQVDHQIDGRKNRKRGLPLASDTSSRNDQNNDGVLDLELSNFQNVGVPRQGPANVAAIKEALENSKELVSLEEYYYGTRDSDSDIVEKECRLESLNTKCPMCQTIVSSNIALMTHILGHSEDNPSLIELSSLIMCKYCVQKFRSTEDLDIHLKQKHKNFSSSLMCLICIENFETRQKLIAHMHECHVQLELPFQCSICFYRSSEQYKLVDHFYEVHAGGEKIQCPFCLKCVAISSNGKKMPANTYFFMHHVRKHQSRTSSRRCDRCALWFVHKGILREHQSKDHISFTNDPRVVPYSGGIIDGVMMPLPGISLPHSGEKTGSNFTCKLLDGIVMNGLQDNLSCAECNSTFNSNHIRGYMSCLHCSFSSCCSDAMAKHLKVFHCKDRPSEAPHPVCALSEEMHCACGHKSRDGNALATHLIKCGRQTVYASSALPKVATLSGKSASFPPLVTLDEGSDASEKWMQAFSKRKECDLSLKEKSYKRGKEQPSMLNVLGLVRKNSVEENSNKGPTFSSIEDENSKERPMSRGSNGSSSSRSRKRVAEEAGLNEEDHIEIISKSNSLATNHLADSSKNNTADEHSKEVVVSQPISPDLNCKVSSLSEITVIQVRKAQ